MTSVCKSPRSGQLKISQQFIAGNIPVGGEVNSRGPPPTDRSRIFHCDPARVELVRPLTGSGIIYLGFRGRASPAIEFHAFSVKLPGLMRGFFILVGDDSEATPQMRQTEVCRTFASKLTTTPEQVGS